MDPWAAMQLYVHAAKDGKKEHEVDEIDAALVIPNRMNKRTGRPDWYGTDEEAWQDWLA